ncbi:inactive protein RESTRICTED TEV MOVEMENT 2-like [Zingiber officinale]|uniref:inactive protein RESTRICTED TEV MOVEMENT 2-like n=1 Tax=Zingiber officinale TaxID=94328 RepID=UPI001C4D3057|nr:inactive protein RESTRICTED TEV MOVEMENT 2-like [Zingiber officinale]
MERSPSSVPEQRLFVDFVPLDRVVSSNEAEFFVVELPGFRKEHISIRINDFGNLKITGERPLVGNRWSRFVKEFQVPDHCNASEIKAALENGLLRIELPKFGTQGDTARPEASPETRDDGRESGLRQRTKSRTTEPVGSIGQPLMEEKKKTEEKREEMAETGKKLQCEFRSRSRMTIIGILVIAALVGTGIYVCIINRSRE